MTVEKEFKQIPNSQFDVSEDCTLRHRFTKKIIPPPTKVNWYGYLITPHGTAHVILAQAWIPNPNNLEYVIFKDGDLRNISLDNLAWSKEGMPLHVPNKVQVTGTREKPIRLINITSNESYTFDSIGDAANFLEVSKPSMWGLAHKKNKVSRGQWTAEFVNSEDATPLERVKTFVYKVYNIMDINGRPTSVYSHDAYCAQFEGLSNYFVYQNGDVLSKKSGKIIKPFLEEKSGYLCARILGDDNSWKYVRLHRLVAMAFVENPYNKEFVNHIDSDKTNNHYTNLEWITRMDNYIHARESGAFQNSTPVKLTNKKTEEELIFPSVTEASKYIGCTRSTLSSRLHTPPKNQDKLEWSIELYTE